MYTVIKTLCFFCTYNCYFIAQSFHVTRYSTIRVLILVVNSKNKSVLSVIFYLHTVEKFLFNFIYLVIEIFLFILGCSPFKLLYNNNHTMSSIALLYTNINQTRKNLLLEPTVLPAYVNNMPYIQIRTFYMTSNWKGQEPSSKVEETVKNIKEEKELKEKMTDSVVKNCEPNKAVAKVTMWQKIKGEILHYYHGFRLLGLDMKVSAKLIWRILHGKELSRREHRLVCQTENCNTHIDETLVLKFIIIIIIINYFNSL